MDSNAIEVKIYTLCAKQQFKVMENQRGVGSFDALKCDVDLVRVKKLAITNAHECVLRVYFYANFYAHKIYIPFECIKAAHYSVGLD